MTNDVKLYLVGGAVREIVRGHEDKIKDWDFAVEAKSFDHMRDWMVANGFEIFVETPQYMTIRARTPKDGFTFAGRDMTGKTFDFALCRTESGYTDGRRPDSVQPATIESDLSRRDFTMNAMALSKDTTLLDPFGGQKDIEMGLIRCVGKAYDRMEEDALRMLRAVRFKVQLGFSIEDDLHDYLYYNRKSLRNIEVNRVSDELYKALKINTHRTLETIANYGWSFHLFGDGDLWLMPTQKGRKG